MRLSSIVYAGLFLLRTSVAQSSLLDELPACAAQCFGQTVSLSKCDPTDFACLCADEQFMQAAAGCQAMTCTVKESLTSAKATMAACGVEPKDSSATIIAIPAAFGSLAIIMVALRVIDRLWVRHVGLDIDDYLVVVAMILALPMNIVCFPMAHYGMGKDFWSLSFDEINHTLMCLYIAEIFYMAAEMCVQLSLLAFYLRIFTVPLFRKLVYGMMVLVLCFGITNTICMLIQCLPIPFFWEGWAGETQGTCIDINLFSWIRAGIEIGIDVAILSLPIPTLLKLQMSTKKKVQVVMVFCIGFVITLISILRLQSLIQFSETANPTYDNAPAVYWSILECNMFIICACMPAMRGFLRTFLPSCFGSTANNTPSGTSAYLSRDKMGSNAQYLRQPSDGQAESDVELVDSELGHNRKNYTSTYEHSSWSERT